MHGLQVNRDASGPCSSSTGHTFFIYQDYLIAHGTFVLPSLLDILSLDSFQKAKDKNKVLCFL
jgi:hypothetical protein